MKVETLINKDKEQIYPLASAKATLYSESEHTVYDAVENLKQRVTALEQGGGGGSLPFEFAISDDKYGFMREGIFVPFYNQYPKIEIVSSETKQFALYRKGIGNIISKINSSNVPYETLLGEGYDIANIGNSSVICTDGKIIFGNPFTYSGSGEVFNSVIADATKEYDATQINSYFGEYKDYANAEYNVPIDVNVTYLAICTSSWGVSSTYSFKYTDASGVEHIITPTNSYDFYSSNVYGHLRIDSFEINDYIGEFKATFDGFYRVQSTFAWY